MIPQQIIAFIKVRANVPEILKTGLAA